MIASSLKHTVPVLIKVELKPQGRLLMEARYFLEKKGESVLHTQLYTHIHSLASIHRQWTTIL